MLLATDADVTNRFYLKLIDECIHKLFLLWFLWRRGGVVDMRVVI